MFKYQCLLFDSDRTDLWTVEDYQVGDFDIDIPKYGVPYPASSIPDTVQIHVDTSGTAPDLLGNPLGWLVMSETLWGYLEPLAAGDAEVFPAPLFDSRTRQPLDGFFLVNPTLKLPCLDMGQSEYQQSPHGDRIRIVTKYVLIHSQIPDTAHLFRIEEFPRAVVLSDTVAGKLAGTGVKGLAAQRCYDSSAT